jgi:hypothetical protein
MSSSSKRRARRHIAKENTFWRVVPMEVVQADQQDGIGPTIKETLIQDHPKAEIIDTPFEDCFVVLVPPTCSYDMARSIEQRVMDSLGKPVIVMTNNLKLCRVEGPLSEEEIVATFKGVENADPEKLAAALVNRAKTSNAEAVRELEAKEEASGDAAPRLDPFAGALPDISGDFAEEDSAEVTEPGTPAAVGASRIDTSAGPDPAQPEND